MKQKISSSWLWPSVIILIIVMKLFIYQRATNAELIITATDRIYNSAGDKDEMVRQAKILAQATSDLVQAIKFQADGHTDSEEQKKLLAAAKQLADATAKLVEAAKVWEMSPGVWCWWICYLFLCWKIHKLTTLNIPTISSIVFLLGLCNTTTNGRAGAETTASCWGCKERHVCCKHRHVEKETYQTTRSMEI